MTNQVRSKLVTLQTGNAPYVAQALPLGGAKGTLRVLTALALAFAVAIAASIGLEATGSQALHVSGYVWDDRDDDTGDSAQVAGFV
ncbi:MAG: hypothetical protein QNI86_04875, partial [Halieaceae bacterium]|nr:hypothetical protein [Halieaceae bacterium]